MDRWSRARVLAYADSFTDTDSDRATPTVTPTATPPATPTPTVQVTVQTNPGGLAFAVHGTTYSSTQTFSWPSGSTHTIATTSPQNGGTGVQYVWVNWSDTGAISHTVAPATNVSYTANFRTQYYLTMSHGTGGTVSPVSGWKNAGSAVSIRAMPATGYSLQPLIDTNGHGDVKRPPAKPLYGNPNSTYEKEIHFTIRTRPS